MGLPYFDLFAACLAGYLVYSEWVRLPSWYPLAGALAAFTVAMAVEAEGQSGTADTLALYAFVLFLGALALYVVDAIRRARGPGGPRSSAGGREVTADPSGPGDPASQEPLDRFQQ